MSILVLVFVFLVILLKPFRVFAVVLAMLVLLYFCPFIVVFGIVGAVLMRKHFGDKV